MADEEVRITTLNTWKTRVDTYGAMVVTMFIFGLFTIGMIVTSRNHDSATFNALLETVKALTMVAAGYWIGTSNSSSKKDDIIAANAAMLATSVPGTAVLPGQPAPTPPPDPGNQ